MTIHITLEGVQMRVEYTHYPRIRDTWDEPGEAEHVELEAIYTLHGDNILPLVIHFGTACVIEDATLAAHRDEYDAVLAEHLDSQREERRLAG